MGFVVRGELLTVWGAAAIAIEVRSNIRELLKER